MELVYVTVLGGPLNRPAYIVGGNCWNYTRVIAGSSPVVSEQWGEPRAAALLCKHRDYKGSIPWSSTKYALDWYCVNRI